MEKKSRPWRVIWTRERILATIKARANSDHIVTSVPILTTVAIRMFGSWNIACREAGCIAFKNQPAIPNCIIDGCLSKPRGKRSLYCEKHNARLRRNGHVELRQPPKLKDHSSGYKLLYDPKHPLTMGSRVFEHRAVFYNEHGEGPFRCHWCDKEITWNIMHVDHVNGIRDDNRIENLVASCAKCNQKRGYQRLKTTIRMKSGLSFDGLTLSPLEWAQRLDIPLQRINKRIRAGWSVERALTEPRGKTGPKTWRETHGSTKP